MNYQDILIILAFCAVFALITFIVYKHNIKAAKADKVHRDILVKEVQMLSTQVISLEGQKTTLTNEIDKYSTENASLQNQVRAAAESVKLAQQNSQITLETLEDNIQEKLDQSAERKRQLYEEAIAEYQEQYNAAMADYADAAAAMNNTIMELRAVLDSLSDKVKTAREAAIREEEKKLADNKYKIIIDDISLQEINKLRDIVSYFRNPRPIYKIIWEGYYRTATNELLGRIIPEDTAAVGIYKITEIESGKCYIGQSVNIKDRITQHIKYIIGIDTPNNNKFYSAAHKIGAENFTYEVLEFCNKEDLNDREVFWIDYYQSQTWGYNDTKGGARK